MIQEYVGFQNNADMIFRILIVLLFIHIISFITEYVRYKEMNVSINCYKKHHIRDRVFLLIAIDILLVFINLCWIVFEWIMTGNINGFISFYQTVL